MTDNRRETSYHVRVQAAEMARSRYHAPHTANPDEQRYAAANYPMSFTKGLHHCPNLGVVADKAHFEAFRSAIDSGWIEPFTSRVPVPPPGDYERRKWEAPTAGVVYDLEGPDAQAVTMAPAPELCSPELSYEMAEVYELALLRDLPFHCFDQNGGPGSGKLNDAIGRLNALPYSTDGFYGRPRTINDDGEIDRQTAFRGSSPGVAHGPYISQFLWIGNKDQAGGTDVGDGKINFGAQAIDQRVLTAVEDEDYMQLWDDWYNVQQGFRVQGCTSGQNLWPERRFIYTPRDLATYVHFDALYQAYLNACLILLGMETPFDPGFAKLSGMRDMHNPAAAGGTVGTNAGGFALYGGPHILTLVTEVATRALKAVRFQKFNNHLRLRPEALAARMHCASQLDDCFPVLCGAFGKMRAEISDTVEAVEAFNQDRVQSATALLPMAFQEGSPMHPTYGAGHATVAGACVTILKAYFDTGTVFGQSDEANCTNGNDGFYHKICDAVHYVAKGKGARLEREPIDCPLTLEGELNKLAANISIGRNMAGVHYYSDYYDSLRMGEEIAIGLLEEQALCYPTDEFVLSVPTFDGGNVRIGRR